MKFKTGDRVHVIRKNGKETDFYATLVYFHGDAVGYRDSTERTFDIGWLRLPSSGDFGPDKLDYFEVVTDEKRKVGSV